MQDILTEAGAKEYPDWPGYWVLPTGVIVGPRGKPLKPWLTGSGYHAIKLGKYQRDSNAGERWPRDIRLRVEKAFATGVEENK